jgi:hypothetical protein
LLPRGSYSPEIVYSYTVIKYCVSVIKVYAETMQNASKNLDSSIQEIKRTGVFEEASELLRVARENKSNVGSKIEGQLDLKNYWRTLGRTIQELIRNRQYREIIGPVNADLLERNIIKITGKIKEYNQADAIGDKLKSSIASNEAELYIGEVLRLLDDIYLSF